MEWLETARALGGTAVLGNEVTTGPAFVQRIEEGLPIRALAQLKRYSRLSDADLTTVIPRRTFISFSHAQRLSPEQSDRIARIAAIAAFTQRVFGDAESARDWLLTPNPALEHQAPLRMLRTGSGAELVEAVLIRIEHGVYE